MKNRSRLNNNADRLLARTHKLSGLFPTALLVWGLHENEIETHRTYQRTIYIEGQGEVDQKLETFTESPLGLPCGRDPLVLLAMLKLLFDSERETTAVTFRKKELLKILEWDYQTENLKSVDLAIRRYMAAYLRGNNIWSTNKTERTATKTRRLIISYDVVDERSIRYKSENIKEEERENLYTRVEFHPEIINEIRTNPLGINFSLFRSLRTPITSRLFEVLNFWADENGRDFSFDIIELAHERVGIPKNRTARSQCWERLEKAFITLKETGYIEDYRYNKKTGIVEGHISSKHIVPKLNPLPPLLSSGGWENILKEASKLGANRNVVSKILDELYGHEKKAAQILAYIKSAKETQNNPSFNYGGWLVKELKYLVKHGEIGPTLSITTEHNGNIEEGNHQENTPPPANDAPTKYERADTPNPNDKAAMVWKLITDHLEKLIEPQEYGTWIQQLVPTSYSKGTLKLWSPHPMVYERILESYRDLIELSAAESGAIDSIKEIIVEDEAGERPITIVKQKTLFR